MDPVISLLTDMPFWVWFVIAALLLVGEILTGTLFLLWPALAAAAMGLITTVQLDGRWATQWLLFSAITIALALIGRPYAARWIKNAETDKPGLNQFSSRKIGRTGTVSAAFVGNAGRVRLGDTEWSARLAEGEAPPEEGSVVEVVKTDGTVLVVRPA